MTENDPLKMGSMGALHHFGRPGASRGGLVGYICSHFKSPSPIRPLRMRKIATMKFSSLGMIRIRRPAITDMIGEMWATVRVMMHLL
jgi:hypothetical protein